jgi:pSer/pThr/pTyr-binding forkhead associated (FHA) protein
MQVGRGVVRSQGINVPEKWVQFSGTHCRIFMERAPVSGECVWYVEDLSTNGTFLNDVRVPKKERHAMQPGDTLRLSSPPQEVLQ